MLKLKRKRYFKCSLHEINLCPIKTYYLLKVRFVNVRIVLFDLFDNSLFQLRLHVSLVVFSLRKLFMFKVKRDVVVAYNVCDELVVDEKLMTV